MAGSHQFRLFGTVEVADAAGRPLDLGTRKQRALIAMLAMEPGRVVPLDRLIDELWSGEPPAQATRTLQAYIAHLRKVLEPDRPPRTPPRLLLTREPGYLLAAAPGQVDLERFTVGADEGRAALVRGDHTGAVRVLGRALELWRGDPLGEFADEQFARPVATKLAEVRAAAEEDRFEARLALGEAAACVPGLDALTKRQPYREHGWALLVLALYRTGRQADALAALRRLRARLDDDLGLQPGPELRQLEQAVFDQAPELRLPVQPQPAPAPTASARRADGLIARDAELALADQRLAAARRSGGVLLVSGEAGIGKTRYADEVAERAAARGFTVARGVCVDGTAPAFWPWVQVLREAAGEAAGALLTDEVSAADPDAALYERYERVASALTATGEPLLIVLDDLQWADVSSLRLLSHVAGAVTRRPVLVLVTRRPEPGDHPGPLRDTLGTLARLEGASRVELKPFTDTDVAAYLRARGAAEELAQALLRRTGGNPFYLGEVLRLWESEGGRGSSPPDGGDDALADALPAGVRDVIERRVARLPEETARLLRAAAVAGAEVDADLLAAATGLPIEEVLDGLEPAVATGLLAEPPDGPDYRFGHSLVRDALYAGLRRLDRARLHLRIGEALEPVLPPAEAATLARHFAASARIGGAPKAVTYASKAARHATAQQAYAEAVEFWELAVSALPPTKGAEQHARLLTELGQARRAVGDATGAGQDLDGAFDLARESGDRQALIGILTAFAAPTLWNWRPYGTVKQSVVDAIEELLDGPLDDRDRAALLGALGVELHYGPRRAEGERHAAEAVRLARTLDDPALLAGTLGNYLLASFAPGRNAERLCAAQEMATLPGLPRSTELIARAFLMACLLRAGDLPAWEQQLDHCRRLLKEAPRPELESIVKVAETARATLDGRWAEAEELVGAYATLRFAATPWGARWRTLVTLYTCRRAQGRVAEIADDLVAAAAEPDMTPLRPVAILAAAEAGRTDHAHELIARWGTDIADDWTADFLLPVWGLVAVRLGTPDPQHLYDQLSRHADQFIVAGMSTAAWGSTHTVLAELAARLGRDDLTRHHTHAAAEAPRLLQPNRSTPSWPATVHAQTGRFGR
ncbi:MULTISPECIES: BTAD domain-containing putative transcriptional regulator [unclassified Streptomyces]|uniref:ATP-binding protein n=1 Tax=unclassified Streptomyces TaxID=2593676 RepID=UPI00069B8398|nr:AfsR/SARP family transcriptional regulator [Streptomyces sp. CNQ-509]